jgi:hypothetical protein
MARAVANADVGWLVDHTQFNEASCADFGFPARPKACEGLPLEATVTAVNIGLLQSEGYLADRPEYLQILDDWLTNYKATATDNYGGAEPRLFAYGHSRRPAAAASLLADFESMQTIATRIPPDDTPLGLPGVRQILVLFAEYQKDRGWAITGVSLGNSEPLLTQYLNPAADPLNRIFEFWSPWPPQGSTSPTP